jgi:hypothetical protein
MREHYLLGEVAKFLGRKPHQIVHLLTTAKIPEPQVRIANKRLFTRADIERLARYFRVTPNWAALDPVAVDVDTKPPVHLTLRPPFEVTSIGESGHEVRDGDGEVFGWAVDRGRALVLAGLLEAAARG